MITQLDASLTSRFWKYAQKSSDSCWSWSGARTYGGYGVLRTTGRNGKIIRAHRLSWMMHCGTLPDDIDVCHHCDNPPCVRPDHLFLGTAKTNVADMVSKGRANGGGMCGEDHPMVKLTAEKVLSIRAEYAAGGTSLSRLATKHTVSKKTILIIVKRRTWTHI